ncbi:hypothetical protein M5K25_024214 [Dendrobium thyrsiflorum]|uniref:Uncharacterized protein n=1 Tax=Dendrobium thyrsiflorum TaxID=117978 RepID=A0ABD0U1E2_DENTH
MVRRSVEPSGGGPAKRRAFRWWSGEVPAVVEEEQGGKSEVAIAPLAYMGFRPCPYDIINYRRVPYPSVPWNPLFSDEFSTDGNKQPNSPSFIASTAPLVPLTISSSSYRPTL